MNNKKGQAGAWGTLLVIAIVMALFGMIVTLSSGVQQDVTDDYVTNAASCGANSTGGTGGEILYTACERPYTIGAETLSAQLTLAQKQSTLVTAGVGIFILTLLIGGFSVYTMVK